MVTLDRTARFRFASSTRLASAKAMPISQLPTVKDVISHINYLKNSAKRMKKTTLAEATTVLICGIWKKTGIPIINRKSIINRVNRFIEKNRSNVKQTKKIDKKQDCSQLFLLSKCRCDLISVVTGNIKCSCRKEDQVPPSIIPFLIDQSDTKNGRKMSQSELTTTLEK